MWFFKMGSSLSVIIWICIKHLMESQIYVKVMLNNIIATKIISGQKKYILHATEQP